ncbi:GDP-mannose transporter GONST1-like protein [Tritrichomonas foetus]|uniref:GDP-mannose transporter GONST1-like protein n=1 Tax=Tritrichomonas foetus TaxID=1144522 RepID=A0A1J4K304_9EUKA|nr:GDP-mannose transporter GONST1-like protein [Tritrichomonas foetus]|eukprot:OHT04124.1 GDP-mannose transporter GONST1-like protein [Tritrichomonas foetus]
MSLLMVFVNKLILRAGKVNKVISPEDLLITQCGISAFLIAFLSFVHNFPLKISFSDFAVCSIVNIAFIGTMLANSYTLSYLSIHMVTLLKCLSVVVTAFGDRIFLGHHLSIQTWCSLFLIVIGSGFGLATDLEFSLIGYFWMFLSICFAACYVLLTKVLISHRDLHFFTAAFWNNLLSTFFLGLYIFIRNPSRGCINALFSSFLIKNESSLYLSKGFIIFSGILGLALNIVTFSLLGETSATSYVVVGAGKKIFQAILSFVIFNTETSLTNILSVMIGLSGATLYAYIKFNENKNKEQKKRNEEGNDSIVLITPKMKKENNSTL